MHQHTSKRREIAFRFFTYGVMSVAVIIISLICILLALGYRFDQGSGRVEQQALLQYRSFPADAAVELDNKKLGVTTPEKSTVSPGQHLVRFTKQGYHDWNKTFSVESGNLLWLNYARMIPTSLVTVPVTEFPSLAGMLASPDRRWIALQPDAKKPAITFADIRNEAEPVLSDFALPAGTYSVPSRPQGTFSFSEWDFSSRFILVKYTVGNTTEYLRVDRTDPTATVNVTRQFRITIADAHFVGTSGNILFVLSDGDIRKIDLQAGIISRPLVSNVSSFILYKEDTIAFTGLRNNERVAGVYKDGKIEVITRHFPNDQRPLHVTVSNYFYDDYLAVAYGNEVEVIKDPYQSNRASQLFANFTFEPGIASLRFSSNGRFVLVQNGSQYMSYDLETDNQAHTNLSHIGKITKPVRWLDDYYLWTDVGNTLHIAEFDGANQQNLGTVVAGYDVTLSENGERLFSIGRDQTTKRLVLQSTKMIVE